MNLTEEQLRDGYFEMIKQFTNNFHEMEEIGDTPLPVQIAIEKMLVYSSRDDSIKTESIADLTLTYKDVDGLPQDVVSLLAPYCKARF